MRGVLTEHWAHYSRIMIFSLDRKSSLTVIALSDAVFWGGFAIFRRLRCLFFAFSESEPSIIIGHSTQILAGHDTTASRDQNTSRFPQLVCFPLLWLWRTSQITTNLMVSVEGLKCASIEAGFHRFDSHIQWFWDWEDGAHEESKGMPTYL